MNEYYDVIIVGTGAAGLYCALMLSERKKILILTAQSPFKRSAKCPSIVQTAPTSVPHPSQMVKILLLQ